MDSKTIPKKGKKIWMKILRKSVKMRLFLWFSNFVEKCIYWLVSVNAWIITQVYWYAYLEFVLEESGRFSYFVSTFFVTLVYLPLLVGFFLLSRYIWHFIHHIEKLLNYLQMSKVILKNRKHTNYYNFGKKKSVKKSDFFLN